MTTAADLLEQWWSVLARDSLYAVVVCVAVAMAAHLLRHRSPRLHLLLWSLVLLRLVLPPDLDHPMSAGRLLHRLSITVVARSSAYVVSDLPASAPARQIAEPGPRSQALRPTVALGLVWVFGCAAAVIRLGRRRAAFASAARSGRPINDTRILGLATSWRQRFAIHRRVRLLQTSATVAPFTTGIVRPVIVLPTAVVARPSLAEIVVAHEMAHVARCDALWLGLQQIVHLVYFFNPVAWLAGARLDDARERACDELVLAQGVVTPRAYAGGLLDVLRLDLQGVGALPMASSRRRLHMRLVDILGHPTRPRPPVAAATALIGMAAAVVLPLAGAHVAPEPAARPDPPTAPAPVTAPAPTGAPAPVQLSHPLPGGRLSLGWGQARHPYTGKVFHHNGLDLAAPVGTPVRAAAAGTVVEAVVDYGNDARGRTVMIDHGDELFTTYTHLDEVRVTEMLKVERGEIIGTVGSTGLSTGPHLHFEVRRPGEHLDPTSLVGLD